MEIVHSPQTCLLSGVRSDIVILFIVVDCKPRSSGNCRRVASKQHACVCRSIRTVHLLHSHQMSGASDYMCVDM